MSEGLRALLTGVIDYAGMFPPATLPLHAAIGDYARFRQTPASWMLGHFVVAATDLAELGPMVEELFQPNQPLTVAALGRADLQADLAAIDDFQKLCAGRALVAALEMRLPSDLALAVERIRSSDAQVSCVFVEVPSADAAVALAQAGRAHEELKIGLKLRMGGAHAAAFPSVDQVAAVVAACRDHDLPWKATAGLHHAVRRHNEQLDTKMHGFVNLFGAAVLARSANLSASEIAEILADERRESFAFDAAGCRWRQRVASIDQIRDARARGLRSFGSCNFEEPWEEIAGWGF